MAKLSVSERFWSRVEPSETGCLIWTGPPTWHGYGRFTDSDRLVYAHRWAYESERGPIPDGLFIDHLCRVRLCVNPSHLEVVTSRENIMRGDGVSARAARQTLCKRGHALSPRPDRPGQRECKTCQRWRWQRWAKQNRKPRRILDAEPEAGE